MRAGIGPLERELGDRGRQTGAPGEGLGTEHCNISTGYNQIVPPQLRRLDNRPEALAMEAQRQHSKGPTPQPASASIDATDPGPAGMSPCRQKAIFPG